MIINSDEKFYHDLKNYLYGQQAMTDLCLEHFQSQHWNKLEKSLLLQSDQQMREIASLLAQYKKMADAKKSST